MTKALYFFLACLLSLPISAQSTSFSHVKSRTMTNGNATAWLDHIDYDNGLGQPYQQVDVAITPTGKSLVTLHEYDNQRHPLYTWLPVSISGSDVQNDDALKAAARSQTGDSHPYIREVYEPSPLNRITEQYLPGAAWHLNGKRQRIQRYASTGGNPEGNAMVLTMLGNGLTLSKTPNYQYMVENVADEDGRKTITFTDLSGRVAAIRKFNQSDPQGGALTTYYAHNDFGDLRFVLPPEVAAYYESYSSMLHNSQDPVMLQYGYEYRYDSRHNCIYKRLPGCDPVYYIYDKAGHCIFSQDGVQRTKGEWTYSIPDIFGRTALTGVCKNSLTYTAEPLRGTVVKATRSTSAGNTNGYAVSGVSLSSATVHTVSFYDDYGFIGTGDIPATISYATPPAGGSYGVQGLTTPRGLPTGSITVRIGPSGVSGYDYAAVYYDDQGRVIQTRSTNHMGGTDLYYTGYDFTGNVLKRQHTHQGAGAAPQTETYTYIYDQAGRLVTTRHKLNAADEVTLHQHTYDERGRLIKKTNGSNSAMTVSYTYNLRSWPKTITAGTLFNEKIYYFESYAGSTPCYNGNISAISWKTDANTRGYKFTYDPFARLQKADYLENGNSSGHYNTEYTYDRMGNIRTLKRKGLQDGGTYGLIDNLTFTYNGNQVTRIDDAVTDPTYNGAFNFADGASAPDEYAYDKNGNTTKDLNKMIVSIKYSLLNLPQGVAYANGRSTTYIYDAKGTKLRTRYKVSASAAPQITDYCGNFIYENNSLRQVLIDGGYITYNGTTPIYHYYLQDHLGNNHMVVSASGTVEQINHYYPFGGLFGKSTQGKIQRYKYNGKELDRMHGLDWYDYGARHYDGARGAFTTMDSLAEKYYSISPYVYCLDNPMRFIDIKGKAPGDFFGSIDEAAIDFGNYYNPYSIKQGLEFGSFIMYNPQNRMYYYPKAVSGSKDKLVASISTLKSHGKVATIHTHGAFDAKLIVKGIDWNDEFSGMENTPQENKVHVPQDYYDDIDSANKRGIDSYLVTPNGNLKKYNPRTGEIKVISKSMPSDKNAGDRRVNDKDFETENVLFQLIKMIMSYFK